MMMKKEDVPLLSPFQSLVLHSASNPRRVDVKMICVGPSMTRQEFSDECDINAIMERYEKSGIWPMQMGLAEASYVDYTELPGDLQSTLQRLEDAKAEFMKLPAGVRKEFDNDALRFVEFAADPRNTGRLQEWGLAEPPEAPEKVQKVEVVNPAPPTESPPKGSKT